MTARIEIQDAQYTGELVSVATQASPTGWWDGNVRKFEAIVKLNEQGDIRPGMSAEVEIAVARHENVLTVPVAAVVEDQQVFHCWVETDRGVARRTLKLGDNNDQFLVVEQGLREDDRVVLNPQAFIQEAQMEALKPVNEKLADDAEEPDGAGQEMRSSGKKEPKTADEKKIGSGAEKETEA